MASLASEVILNIPHEVPKKDFGFDKPRVVS